MSDAVAMEHRQLVRPWPSTAEPIPLLKTSGIPANYAKSPTAPFANPQSGNKYPPTSDVNQK
ncbi:hypothetical protein EYZ11_011736 [Aspergillus tanneri]|uniref:Uncharacterized protein n=1 Tax=Aspergillus tanneri TaxID=1220188 RepID=A0A4S3J211_9EURO|nr:hypothetical protein EYZ11_011736 [Aspergillus tanneri]